IAVGAAVAATVASGPAEALPGEALANGSPANGSLANGALTNEALLDTLQRTAFDFFWNEANPANGLIKDRSTPGSACSIASVGFGLSAILIGIDHGWITRDEGRARILTTLETFWNGPQGTAPDGMIGYKGLFYHFLDMNTATRTWDCELSTIDSALLFAGILDAREYFTTDDPVDVQVRTLADSLYYRADWNFFRNGNPGILMGWRPGTGFAGFGQWVGYNEAMILYILAIGSPTHPVPASSWNTWTSGYHWQTQYGYTYVIFPPLFGHQYSHCWIDFRYIQDAHMRGRGITYFENSRRATLAQRNYCIANPFGHIGYGANLWGITACDGPDGYAAHGAPPPQNDDGTIAPTAPAGSIPFTPDESLAVLQNLYDNYRAMLWGPYGFRDAFNLDRGWWDTDYIGIDQGPIVLMIENYRTGAVWERIERNGDVQWGLHLAGFDVATGVAGATAASPRLLLHPASPNPLTSDSELAFELPAPGRAVLTLVDVTGRECATLLDASLPAGSHVARIDPSRLPSGIYYARLIFGHEARATRCLVLR
ncbi:MAG: glucoamylase family protein, partial [Candidatus Eisenbacteria bacterium]|nr:glucoamylase family protein [Candidatus Eisenbacteria bacterium]